MCSFFSAFLLCSGPLHGQVKTSPIARIIGDLPDGTPPLPKPLKPAFLVPAKDILESKTFLQGGRKITVQRIAPIASPERSKRQLAITPSTPASAEPFEPTAEHPDAGVLVLGASVYRPKDGAARTHVNLWPQDGARTEAVGFWSSADFALLSGFSSFIGSDGKSRSILMAWDNQEIATLKELTAPAKDPNALPPLPSLPAVKASFAITSGKPDAATLAAIQSLHDLYNSEFTRLQAAYTGREKARLIQEAALKAHPPKPKDITLSFWRTESPTPATQEKGTAR